MFVTQAEVLRMASNLMGKAQFTEGVKHYLKKHDGTAATVYDFMTALNDVNPNVDLSQVS